MLDWGVGWYDRDGKAIGLEAWSMLHASFDYRLVAKTQVGAYEVSTVWLGMDHGFGDGPPVIFETMVFATVAGPYDLDCWRYSTEQQAREGHEEVVLLLRATVEEEPPRPPDHSRSEGEQQS